MTQKEQQRKKKTDQAWSYLYNRLEEEGLLAQPKVHRLHIQTYQWAAAVLFIGLFIGTAWFMGSREAADKQLLTAQNGNETTALVTTLEDGSIVYLADNTSLQYPAHFRKNKREVALQGNALFEVSGNRERPFLIETGEARIEVIGTAFNVKSAGKAPFELSVQRGEVKVTLKESGQTVRVKAGETVTLHAQQLKLGPTLDPGQFIRYTERIQFKDARLADILRVINREETDVILETTPALADRKLTVSFLNDTPGTMAELICLALKLKCTQEANRLLLTEP